MVSSNKKELFKNNHAEKWQNALTFENLMNANIIESIVF